MNEAKEEIEELVKIYNSTKNEKIKPGLEGELLRALTYFKTSVE